MPVDPSLLDGIIAASTKRMNGVQTIRSGDMVPAVHRIPFDSLELNMATYGGAGMGRMIRLWGPKSSCKSMIAWGLAKQAQQHRSERFPNGLTIAYYNAEGAYDPIYVRDRMGVDISPGKLIISDGAMIEDVSEKLDSLLHAVNLHIIDSASFCQSVHKFTAKKESRQPGLDAQAWGAALTAAEENMDKQENMIVIIDQARVDFKTGALKVAGGMAADHASSMTLKCVAAKKLYRVGGELVETRPKQGNDPLSGSHRVDGREIDIEVEKSRICRPFGKARLTFDIDKLAFDKLEELKKAGIFLGVIEQSGSYFKIPTSDKSIQGVPKLKARLAEDWQLATHIMEAANDYMKNAVYA
jgi:RecA/RadA recombinase